MISQRGFHLNWGRRGKRNARRRENIQEELLQRLEAIEYKVPHEDSKE